MNIGYSNVDGNCKGDDAGMLMVCATQQSNEYVDGDIEPNSPFDPDCQDTNLKKSAKFNIMIILVMMAVAFNKITMIIVMTTI